MKTEKAAASLYAFLVIIALSVICFATILTLGSFQGLEKRSLRLSEERLKLDNALSTYIDCLKSNIGDSDSKINLQKINMIDNAITISINDISSRINPNWVKLDLLRQPILLHYAISTDALDRFRQVRNSVTSEPRLSSSDKDTFKTESYDSIFTSYSYADLNTSDIKMLATIYERRTGDATAAKDFAARISINSIMKSDQLRNLLFPYYAEVFPIICIAPPLNVNFVNQDILKALLSMSEFAIENPDARTTDIISTRLNKSIGERELYSLLRVPPENSIFTYLGVRTWFWEIVLKSSVGKLTAIIARVPPGPGRTLQMYDSVQFAIISREFSL